MTAVPSDPMNLLRRYEQYFTNTGGNDLEALLKGRTEAFSNLPLAMLEHGVQSQAVLLARLHTAGLLGDNPTAASARENSNELIVVEWNPGSETFSVAARSAGDQPWSTWEGQPEELPELLSIACNVVTGG